MILLLMIFVVFLAACGVLGAPLFACLMVLVLGAGWAMLKLAGLYVWLTERRGRRSRHVSV
jgi:hypothetical protein